MSDDVSIADVLHELRDDVARARSSLLSTLSIHDQEDVMQDAFQKLITRHRPGRCEEEIRKQFWYCVKESRSEFFQRQKKRIMKHEAYFEEFQSGTGQFSGPEQGIIIDGERCFTIREALDLSGLSLHNQALLLLTYGEGWRVCEIAEAFQEDPELISSRLYQAKQQAKEGLRRMDDWLDQLARSATASDEEGLIRDLTYRNGKIPRDKAVIVLTLIYEFTTPGVAVAVDLTVETVEEIVTNFRTELSMKNE